MSLTARVDSEGDVEVRDDARGCLILFEVQQLRGGMSSIPPNAVAGWGDGSEVDRARFITEAWHLASDFAQREGLI